MIKDENFVQIQGWMINRLNLKGNELIVYATIYGFTQDGENWFEGSRQYLSDWCNSSKQGVQKNLQSLVEKGLLIKQDILINGVKFCKYKVNLDCIYPDNKVDYPPDNKVDTPRQQSCPNNIINKDTINNNSNKKERKKKEIPSFDELFDKYTNDDKTKELLKEWLKIRKAKRAPFTNKAIELNLKKLEKLAKESDMNINQYLEEVILRGWAAFFPITNYSNKNLQSSKPKQSNIDWNEWDKKYNKPITTEESNKLDKEYQELLEKGEIF